MAGSRTDPQLSFASLLAGTGDELQFGVAELALRDTTFVVVDLETTGGRAKEGHDGAFDAITEIGAVKVHGGEVVGEFGTLVDPGRAIPPQIVELNLVEDLSAVAEENHRRQLPQIYQRTLIRASIRCMLSSGARSSSVPCRISVGTSTPATRS